MTNKSANAVIDRLQQVFDTNSDSELCRIVNMNRATLGNWRIRDSVPYSLCVNISEEKKVSLDWLLTGEGEIYKNEPRLNPVSEQRAQIIVELYEALGEDQQKEILAAIEEKKRMNELVDRVNQLQKKVG